MSLPNILTLLRILIIPIIVWLILLENNMARWIAVALFIAAAITDYFDGYLARVNQQTSDLGRMLDPIADKLLVAALIVAFAFDHTLSQWDLLPAIAIIMREVFVSGLREFLGNREIVLHVSKLAKYKTTLQLIALGLLFSIGLVPVLNLFAVIALWLAALLTVWTGYEYLRAALPHLKETPK